MYKVLKVEDRFYHVYEDGKIVRLSFKTKRGVVFKETLCKNILNRSGYIQVHLGYRDGKHIYKYLHRILAELYVPNPHNKPFVNHINGVKVDFSLKNLEWVTHQENIQHAIDTGLYTGKPIKYKILCFDSEGNFYKKFNSTKEAAQTFNVNTNSIRSVVATYSRTSKGYWFCKEGKYDANIHTKEYIKDRFVYSPLHQKYKTENHKYKKVIKMKKVLDVAWEENNV